MTLEVARFLTVLTVGGVLGIHAVAYTVDRIMDREP